MTSSGTTDPDGAGPLTPMSPERLLERVAEHEQWVRSAAEPSATGARLVLSEVSVARARADGRDLSGCELIDVVLRESSLRDASLDDALVYRCDLARSELRGLHCVKADLRRTILSGADLRGANLDRTDLNGTNLRAARLNDASLYQAILDGADCTQADLSGADLRRASLRGTTMVDVHLLGARGLDEVADPQIVTAGADGGRTTLEGEAALAWLRRQADAG